MSAAAAATTDAAPAPRSKKKLIVIIAAAVLVLALGGAAAMMLLKKKPADADGDEDAAEPSAHATTTTATKHDPKATPIFVPLEAFTVNLADRDAERYAQIGVTLEIAESRIGDQIKVFMPAIRHAVLLQMTDRTAAQLMERDGKLKLARDIQRETSRVLGFEVDNDGPAGESAEAAPPRKGKPKARKKAPAELPVRAVHFSNFIIQ